MSQLRPIAFALLFTMLPPAASGAEDLKAGERVLALWKPRSDAFHYPARVLKPGARWVDLAYDDGSRARVPRRYVRRRQLRPGDLVVDSKGPAVLTALKDGRAALLQDPFSRGSRSVAIAELKTLLAIPDRVPKPEPEPGDRVWAKWDRGAWYVGVLRRRQGEARLVVFLDGSLSWVPAHALRPFSLKKGQAIKVTNITDGQAVDGRLLSFDLEAETASVAFFDGGRQTRPMSRLVAELDGPLVDPADGELTATPLAAWSLKRARLAYAEESEDAAPELGFVELGLAAFYPKDRKPRAGWSKVLEAYAAQSRAFLTRALGAEVKVKVRVHPRPLVGARDFAWYRRELRDSSPWLRWEPSARAARALFPAGPRPGGRCIVAVFPDLPGLSADESGVEGGFGFVRSAGDLLSRVDLRAATGLTKRPPAETSFETWRPAYQATTLCHEALHTLGLPHADSKPWTIMNLGPWHPLTRSEVRLHPLHALLLRSPFKRSLSLSQAWAGHILDRERRYRDVLRGRRGYDSVFAMIYGEERGFLELDAVLRAFGPGTACRQGDRKDSGERRLLRAYLISVVDYVVEVHGAGKLAACFGATESTGLSSLARACGLDEKAFVEGWRSWLLSQLGG